MILTLLSFLGIGLALLLMAFKTRVLTKRARRWHRRVGTAAAVMFSIMSLPFIAVAAYMSCFLAMGQPGPATRKLTRGIIYERKVFTSPRSIVVHVAKVNLKQGNRLVVTPPLDTATVPKNAAHTATQAIDQLQADLVINASFFSPFHETHPLDFYPHNGDLVQAIGTTISHGKRYGQAQVGWVTFWVGTDGQTGFGDPPINTEHAVTGRQWLVHQGLITVKAGGGAYPRTALGLDKERQRLWLIVVDGKQPNYSLGMSYRELATLFVQLGATDAIELDGGGSSTMAARNEKGSAVLLSRPCHTKIPMRQRPIANFLGVISNS